MCNIRPPLNLKVSPFPLAQPLAFFQRKKRSLKKIIKKIFSNSTTWSTKNMKTILVPYSSIIAISVSLNNCSCFSQLIVNNLFLFFSFLLKNSVNNCPFQWKSISHWPIDWLADCLQTWPLCLPFIHLISRL